MILSCIETQKRLNTFVDRELTPPEGEEVQWHLDRCPPCRALFHFDEALNRLVKDKAAELVAPKELRDGVMARLKELASEAGPSVTPEQDKA